MFEDIFGFDGHAENRDTMAERITVRADLEFNESVNGTKKVPAS